MSRSFPVLICRTNVDDHAALGVTGLPTKPSSGMSKMFDPTERSSVPSSAVLILDPSSSLRSFIDWRACCGDFAVPAQSKLACLRFRANLYPHVGSTAPADPANGRGCKLPLKPMVETTPTKGKMSLDERPQAQG
jgi:hypothetical protein